MRMSVPCYCQLLHLTSDHRLVTWHWVFFPVQFWTGVSVNVEHGQGTRSVALRANALSGTTPRK